MLFHGLMLNRPSVLTVVAASVFALLTIHFISYYTGVPVPHSNCSYPTTKVSMGDGAGYKAIAYFVNW